MKFQVHLHRSLPSNAHILRNNYTQRKLELLLSHDADFSSVYVFINLWILLILQFLLPTRCAAVACNDTPRCRVIFTKIRPNRFKSYPFVWHARQAWDGEVAEFFFSASIILSLIYLQSSFLVSFDLNYLNLLVWQLLIMTVTKCMQEKLAITCYNFQSLDRCKCKRNSSPQVEVTLLC